METTLKTVSTSALATKYQRESALKYIRNATEKHKNAVYTRHSTPAKYPSQRQIIAALTRGKLPIKRGVNLRDITLLTPLNSCFDFGQHEGSYDAVALRRIYAEIEAAEHAVTKKVMFANITGEHLIPLIEDYDSRKF